MKMMKYLMYSLIAIMSLGLFTACDDKENSDEESMFTPPILSIENVIELEGDEGITSFTFKIKSNQAVTESITIDYETQEGEAKIGEDFETQTGTVVMTAGTTEVSIEIEVLADTEIEDDEDFKVIISSTDQAEISNNTAIGTIRNDDTAAPIDDEGYSTPLTYPDYTLIWSDEFEGTTLNTDDWNYETGNSGWGNNELQNYVSGENNASLNNGRLVIEAREESSGGSNYTSARITTQGKQFYEFGRIDIRAKLPQGQGIWPALWMLGESFSSVGWPFCGEIDIMEIIGNEPSILHGTIHWDSFGNYASYSGDTSLSSGTFSDEFHVFSIIWDEESIKWYLDDNLYHTASITDDAQSEFRAPFFFIFNVAVGGNWPGSPDTTTVFPQQMIVDYIRVFQ